MLDERHAPLLRGNPIIESMEQKKPTERANAAGRSASAAGRSANAAGRLANLRAWLATPQPRLGIVGMIVLMLCSGMSTAVSLDMYTPAIPAMVGALHTNEGMVNLTLVGFFAAGSIGLLLFGTVSDKFGRKPVLLAGAAVYAGASLGCAFVSSIEALIVLRIVAALGSGALGAVGTAVIKDAIVPDRREKLISLVQIMFVFGPVIAPILGALLLQVTSWRGIFVAIAIFGGLQVVLACLYKETLPAAERSTDSVLRTMGHLGDVMRNRGFAVFLLDTALLNLPFMAYIAVGSYVYEEFFGLSELGYSIFFGIAAIVTATGPIIYLAISKRIGLKTLTTGIFALGAGVGAAMVVIGWLSPVVFCVLVSAYALLTMVIRPYSTNILLNQQEGDTGAASSMMNFMNTMLGVVGMLLAVAPWPTFVFGVGMLMAATSVASLVIWVYIQRKPVIVKGLTD